MFSSSKSYFQPGKPSLRRQQDVKTFFKWLHITGEAIFLPATSMVLIFPPELPPKSCCYGCQSGKEKRENWSLVLTSQQYVNGLPKRTCANVRLVWAQSFGCVWRSTQEYVLKNLFQSPFYFRTPTYTGISCAFPFQRSHRIEMQWSLFREIGAVCDLLFLRLLNMGLTFSCVLQWMMQKMWVRRIKLNFTWFNFVDLLL